MVSICDGFIRKKRFFRTLLATAVISLLLVGSTSALQIRVYDSVRHNRFASGYASNPVANTNFFQDYYDFSGIGWNTTAPYLSYTLISPKHFIGANHVRAGAGSNISFQGRDGVVRTYTVANTYNLTNSAGENTDLYVGEFSQAIEICDNITFYPILSLLTEANYTGLPLVVYGRDARAGTSTINAFLTFGGDPITGGAGINDTRAYSFPYVIAGGGIDECRFERGDSGSPSFVVTNSELFVVGVHLAMATTPFAYNNVDTFVPNYLDQITAVLQQRGYQPATSAAKVFRVCYDVTKLSANAIKVSWIGHRRRVYQLNASTNLVDYSPISGLITAQVSTVSFTDSNAVNAIKFYRTKRVY